MKEHNIIKDKSIKFAINIIKLTKELQSRNEYILANQILRSGTSIGANIAESEYAASKADFINKLAIAQKEAAETKYWLEILFQTEIINSETYVSLKKDVDDILRILAKIIITSKKD